MIILFHTLALFKSILFYTNGKRPLINEKFFCSIRGDSLPKISLSFSDIMAILGYIINRNNEDF